LHLNPQVWVPVQRTASAKNSENAATEAADRWLPESNSHMSAIFSLDPASTQMVKRSNLNVLGRKILTMRALLRATPGQFQ